MAIWILLLAVGLIAVSGMPSLLLGRHSAAGQWIAAVSNVVGSAVGGAGLILRILPNAQAEPIVCSWSLPVGRLAVGVDALTAWFLLPMLLISALGSIYGLEYWKQEQHPRNARKLRFCWGLLTASMMLVIMARDGVLLLMAWELMALLAFFLVTTEERKAEVRRAGWVYLVAAHVGTLCLFAMFGLLFVANGSFDLWLAPSGDVPNWLVTSVFVTALLGFGLKAGIMPLHVWLPGAHANAPSHVSAILSGVLLKTGVYGIIRVVSLVPHPPTWWGALILAAGCLTGVLGIAFAVAQHDFKRLLAYSSIENLGIVMIGLGLALLGRSANRHDWVALGLAGALLHVLNHSLFKPLLFMGAGCVLHATNTRQIDLLGGLAKTMPRTSRLFVLGAIAICGLPPLNGFVGELLIYIGLLSTTTAGAFAWAALAAPALAMVGALAVAGFVKLVSTLFAGTPRTPAAKHAHDPSFLMLAPMLILAACCVIIGIAPFLLAGALDGAVSAWAAAAPEPVSIRTLVPWGWISVLGLLLVAASASGVVLVRRTRRRQDWNAAGTWDCGYALPTPRMQYTGSSFGQMLTDLFGWALLPTRSITAITGLFARASTFATEVPDTTLDRGLLPAFSFTERALGWARPLQRGPVQVYILYVLGALSGLLLFAWW